MRWTTTVFEVRRDAPPLAQTAHGDSGSSSASHGRHSTRLAPASDDRAARLTRAYNYLLHQPTRPIRRRVTASGHPASTAHRSCAY